MGKIEKQEHFLNQQEKSANFAKKTDFFNFLQHISSLFEEKNQVCKKIS